MIDVRVLDGDSVFAHADDLASVLLDCVHGGASVGFMGSLTLDEARTYYDRVCSDVAAGGQILLAAFEDADLVGTVQVLLAALPNGLHRGEIAKMLVRRSARKKGVAAALLRHAEAEARAAGKTLLVLDAVTDGDAARLYAKLGWTRVGDVPAFALYPDGSFCSTTYFYQGLRPTPQAPIFVSFRGRTRLFACSSASGRLSCG